MKYEKNIIAINRHRLNTDGRGVTTLVAFYGCPLHCRYCINSQCNVVSEIEEYLTPLQLYEKIKIDNLYFLVTGGGIVFGGGEPLLYSNFIVEFCKICNINWNISVETSLNVDSSFVKSLVDIIDCWIIDIKDWNEDIYFHYTGNNNKIVKKNLQYLISMGLTEKIIIRVPNIPNYNTKIDIINSLNALYTIGVKHIEQFDYIDNIKSRRKLQAEYLVNIGKFRCEVLKSIRTHFAKCNYIKFQPHKCNHIYCSTGCCPLCDDEARWLTKQYYKKISQKKYV